MIKSLIDNKTFPLRPNECHMRFNSPFSSAISRPFLLIVIRKPLSALSLGHYTEYYLASPCFIIRIVENFKAWPKNGDKDLL